MFIIIFMDSSIVASDAATIAVSYPSIHFLYPSSFTYTDPSWHWASGGIHPGQVASQSQGRHIETPLTLTFTGQFRVSFDCESKPECPKKTHAGTRRTSELHTEGWWVRTQNPPPCCPLAVISQQKSEPEILHAKLLEFLEWSFYLNLILLKEIKSVLH